MKLSDLVQYQNKLQQLDVTRAHLQAMAMVQNELHPATVAPIQIENHLKTIQEQINNIKTSFETIDATVESIQQQVARLVDDWSTSYFQNSYKLYEEMMAYDTPEHILSRRMNLNEDSVNMIRGRLKGYSDWRLPGMIIRPGLENFIQDMVSYDPLYVIDHDHELLQPCKTFFPQDYHNRMRLYTVHETLDQDILTAIPNEQMGMCFVYNFFNFKPLEIIRKYLTEIYQKLRPGGVLIMTFNDCDSWYAVKLAEHNYSCYTPGRLIKNLAASLGYEQIFFWNDRGANSWLELRKPGTLTTLRGGQTLAKIVPN